MAASRDIVDVLPSLLAKLERPGDFWGRGTIELPVVRLNVDGVGTLGLPLPSLQAQALARIATPAPYGRGPDTILDPKVRRCGQIPAEHVDTNDARWGRTLDGIVAAAAAALGVDGKVTADLYKLLVYEPGDFFAAHRDTEKVAGMFATLVVVLPSEHAGGELVVRHDGREATLDMATSDLGLAQWAAFYADCQHELRPLRSGHRISLVYNLVRAKGRPPRVPDARPDVARVATALRAWAAQPESPLKVVYPLKHQYSLAELTFGALKNEDAATADVLEMAAQEAGFILRLAMVSIEESGSAEPIWEGRSRRRYWEHDHEESEAYEVVEVHERTQSLDAWRRPDDSPEPLGRLPYDDGEVSPPGALAEEEPDEDHFHEASGNEGCSFERTYRRAALVLWPASRELAVLHQGGPEAGVAVLERLLDAEPARAGAMAELVVTGWERGDGHQRGQAALRARLIGDLARLPGTGQLERFLAEVVCAGSVDGTETEAMVPALARVEPAVAGALVERLAGTCAVQRFAPVARLLAAAAASQPGATFARAVGVAIGTMPRIGDGTYHWSDTGSEIKVRAGALVDLVGAIGACSDESLARALVASVLENYGRWPMDGVVVPASLALRRSGNRAYVVAMEGLRRAALEHLRARMALSLAPPPDAMRSPDGLTCACANCTSFRAFLLHPTERAWSLKAAKDYRQHLESHIRAAGSDVDTQTSTRGSPHTLICTKNQASYEARVRQRAVDGAAVRQLE